MNTKKETQKDIAWKKILNKLEKENGEIINQVISSDEIKEITGKEPRILCKFDIYEALPEPLKERNLFVLPIKNKFYKIVEGNGFKNLDNLPEPEVQIYNSKLSFDLETSKRGTSESKYLDIAFNSGLIEHFADSVPLYLTIRGRKYSPPFTFTYYKENMSVESVQVEVDAGFEGEDVIVLIEAKGKRTSSFNIRQLYYPYRFWRALNEKDIINIFFWHDDKKDTYHFCQYDFEIETDYHSMKLEKYEIFRIKQHKITKPIELTDKMIPQADDIHKIVRLVQEVSKGSNNSKLIAEALEFTPRQSSYYRQAAEILRLITLENKKYVLTEKGKDLVRASSKEIPGLIFNQIISIPIIEELITVIKTNKDNQLIYDELIPFIKKKTNLADTTVKRRLRTLFSWFKWIEENIGTFIVSNNKILLKTDRHKTLEDYS